MLSLNLNINMHVIRVNHELKPRKSKCLDPV